MSKSFFAGVAMLAAFVTGAHAQTAVPKEVAEACANQWGADYDMQRYCRGKQVKALANIAIIEARHDEAEKIGNSTVPTFRRVLDRCRSQWSTDYDMVVYCYNKQARAYLDLQDQDKR
jgi:hypothetical protein